MRRKERDLRTTRTRPKTLLTPRNSLTLILISQRVRKLSSYLIEKLLAIRISLIAIPKKDRTKPTKK
jgi:hypothetical protein